MDVKRMLADLRLQHAQIEEVILNLERLAASRGDRRGRPPAILANARKRGRPRGSKNQSAATVAARRATAPAARPVKTMAAGQAGPAEQITVQA